MTLGAPHEQGSAFLELPAEIRLQIYSYLLPEHRLHINLCELSHSHKQDIVPPRKKCSPISTMVSQNLTIEAITRANGLHLLLVSTRTNTELTALLSKVAVRFHCPKCFDLWLRNVSYGLGVGIKWLRHVEILFDVEQEPRIFGPNLQIMTPALSKFMVREQMKQCQHTAYAYYGRMDLMEPPREMWKFEPFVGDPPPLWADNPRYLHRPPEHMTQAILNAYVNGGLHTHPWILNQGFPPPGMGLPIFHGHLVTGQALRRGYQRVVHHPGLRLGRPAAQGLYQTMDNDDDNDEYGPVQRKWIISGYFDI